MREELIESKKNQTMDSMNEEDFDMLGFRAAVQTHALQGLVAMMHQLHLPPLRTHCT